MAPKKVNIGQHGISRAHRGAAVAIILLCLLLCTYFIFSQLNNMHAPAALEAPIQGSLRSSPQLPGQKLEPDRVAENSHFEVNSEVGQYKDTSQIPAVMTISHQYRPVPKVITISDQHTYTPPVPAVVTTNGLGQDTILLIICSKRPQYLQRSLNAVLKYHPK